MEVSIDGSGNHVLILQGQFTELSVAVEDGSSIRSSQVEHGEVAAMVAIDVTIHAGVVGVFMSGKHLLFEVFNVPFSDFHFVPYFVGRFDEAIAQIAVYLVFADSPSELGIAYPFPFCQGDETHVQCLALYFFHECFPFLQRKAHLMVVRCKCPAFVLAG